MQPKLWSQVEEMYHSAAALQPEERGGFLEQACGGDTKLRQEVESLLAHERTAENFIESPALQVAASLMDGTQPLAVGQQVDHYRIVSLLGEGGMGVVKLCWTSEFRLPRR